MLQSPVTNQDVGNAPVIFVQDAAEVMFLTTIKNLVLLVLKIVKLAPNLAHVHSATEDFTSHLKIYVPHVSQIVICVRIPKNVLFVWLGM